jgi:RIO kinase 1
VRLAQAEAPRLFRELLGDVEKMLAQGVIHGDFSAYNVLYWEGQVKIIDFPQVVNPAGNPDARFIFGRDVERLCQHFARYGLAAQPEQLAAELWQRHGAGGEGLDERAG